MTRSRDLLIIQFAIERLVENKYTHTLDIFHVNDGGRWDAVFCRQGIQKIIVVYDKTRTWQILKELSACLIYRCRSSSAYFVLKF